VLRILALVGVISTVALFTFLLVFAFTGGNTRNPDELDQIGFADTADAICEQHQNAILALTPAQDVATPAERADVLDEANEILADMIAALRVDVEGRDVVDDLPDARSNSLSPADQAVVDAGTLSAEDKRNLDQWLRDHELYLADRQNHSMRLRDEGDVRFLVTAKGTSQVSEAVDGFARVNDMENCAVPLDL